jgi:hypothetical protein
MYCRTLSLLILLSVLSIALPRALATTIEKDPTKRKGAGPLFQIRRGKKWGYMDHSGKVMIEPRFDSEGDFFHGLARVSSDHKWGYINEKGRIDIEYQFDDALDFIGELAPIRIGRRGGYIDMKGRWMVPPAFQAAGEYFDGLARVLRWTETRCGGSKYTDEYAPDRAYVFPNVEALMTGCGCYPNDQKYSFLDRSGKPAFELKFDTAEDFSNGLALVSIDGEYEFIDTLGRIAIPPKFDEAQSFSNTQPAMHAQRCASFLYEAVSDKLILLNCFFRDSEAIEPAPAAG